MPVENSTTSQLEQLNSQIVHIDELPYGVLLIDKQHLIAMANQTWYELFKHGTSETIGSSIVEFVHPKYINQFNDALDQVWQDHSTNNLMLRVIDDTGQDHWTDICLKYHQREQGPMLLMSISNIGHWVGEEQLLQAQQRSFNTMLNELPGMVYRCRNTPDWTMEYVSGGCKELTGYSTSDIIGNRKLSYGSLIIPQDKDMVWNEVQSGLREKYRFEMVYRIHTMANDLKWVWERGAGIYSDDGELSGIEGIIIDFNRQIMFRASGMNRMTDTGGQLDGQEFLARIEQKLEQSNTDLDTSSRLYCINLDRYEHFVSNTGFHQLDMGRRYITYVLKNIAGEECLLCNPQPNRWYLFSQNKRQSINDEILAIEDAFMDPIQLLDNELYVSVSIGCTRVNSFTINVDRLLNQANDAMMYCLQTGGASSHINNYLS